MHADHHFFSSHPTTNDLYAWHDGGLDVQVVQFIDLQGKIIDQIHVGEKRYSKIMCKIMLEEFTSLKCCTATNGTNLSLLKNDNKEATWSLC